MAQVQRLLCTLAHKYKSQNQAKESISLSPMMDVEVKAGRLLLHDER